MTRRRPAVPDGHCPLWEHLPEYSGREVQKSVFYRICDEAQAWWICRLQEGA